MVCLFRTLNTWEHIDQRDVISWSVPLYAASNKNGTVKVAGASPELADCWAILDGRLFYVEKAAPSDGATTLTLRKPIYAFARDLVYTGNGTEELGSFIAAQLSAEWISQADEMYAMPYLSVSSSGATNADLGLNYNQVYGFMDILLLAEEMGLEFTFSLAAHSVSLAISPRSTSDHVVMFDGSDSQLVSASLTQSLVARVTVRRITVTDADVIAVDETEDYYWHSDGSITTTPPSPRLAGRWAVVSVDNSDISLLDAAQEAMAGNNAAIRVTFYSERVFSLGDRISCRINGQTVTAAITSCVVSNADPRYLYELGALPTTLTEKLEARETTSEEQSVTYEGTSGKPVTSTGGSVDGPLSVATVSAGKIILGANAYGPTLPQNGVPGQLFFLTS